MKRKHTKKITALIAALLAFAVTTANALTPAQVTAVKNAFVRVKVPELAPKAATMVAQASAADKEQMAILVTRTAVSKKHTHAATIVSAIVAVAPETAPAVAAEAAKAVKLAKGSNETIEAVAIEAAKIAPSKSELIVEKVGQAVPASSERVATRVRNTMRFASTPGNNAPTISVQPFVLGGQANTPPTPPIIPATPPSVGFDPRRYQSP